MCVPPFSPTQTQNPDTWTTQPHEDFRPRLRSILRNRFPDKSAEQWVFRRGSDSSVIAAQEAGGAKSVQGDQAPRVPGSAAEEQRQVGLRDASSQQQLPDLARHLPHPRNGGAGSRRCRARAQGEVRLPQLRRLRVAPHGAGHHRRGGDTASGGGGRWGIWGGEPTADEWRNWRANAAATRRGVAWNASANCEWAIDVSSSLCERW